MPNFNWKDLLANRDRRTFPEVVVPLGHDSHAPAPAAAPVPVPEPDAEKKPDADDTSNTSIDRASSQEKGISTVPPAYGSSALEILRGEVENEASASGHNSVYDRTLTT